MAVPELTEPMLASYVLIVVRLSTALVVMPMFGARGVPPHTKIGLALFMGLILVPMQGPLDLPPGLGVLLGATIREAIVGLAIGFAVVLIFQGLELAGTLAGLQMGMGLSAVFDPQTGAQSTALRNFYGVLATLVFFMINAHHQVIAGLFASFELVPLDTFTPADLNMTALIQLSAGMFVIAVRIAMPVVAAVFMADLAMAIIARTMPQLNVLIVGLPIKIVIGLFVLAAAIPATTDLMNAAFGTTFNDLMELLTPLGPG